MTERQLEVLARTWDALYLTPLTLKEIKEVNAEIKRKLDAIVPVKVKHD